MKLKKVTSQTDGSYRVKIPKSFRAKLEKAAKNFPMIGMHYIRAMMFVGSPTKPTSLSNLATRLIMTYCLHINNDFCGMIPDKHKREEQDMLHMHFTTHQMKIINQICEVNDIQRTELFRIALASNEAKDYMKAIDDNAERLEREKRLKERTEAARNAPSRIGGLMIGEW